MSPTSRISAMVAMTTFVLLSSALSSLAAETAPAPANDAQALLNKAYDTMSAAGTFHAKIVQSLKDPNHDMTSEGEVWFQAPDKLRAEMKQGDKQMVL
ncbi:MAG: hypothetical protein NTW86_30895, partial [Candidatus Sumerlaeota bacterium]|nr:hypothetical protein [Candidatus Sumerlaeota bacterium]